MADELRGWIAGSSRFRQFAEVHRNKIRKKLRTAADDEALRDVRAELRVAHLLLADRRLELDFEAFASTGGPDFTVHVASERPTNVEVTRMRRPPSDVRDGGPLLAKLRQLPTSMPNALVVRIDGADARALNVERAVAELRRRADAKDEAFFRRRGFEGTREFYARFLRLGGVVAWCETAADDGRARLWTNPSARIALPDRTIRACLACLQAPP